MLDRRTLLDQRSKAARAMLRSDLPQDVRNLAKTARDHADVALGMQDAQTRKLQKGAPNGNTSGLTKSP